MAFNDTNESKSSFKKLNAKAHTDNNKGLPNEARASGPLLLASEIIAQTINSTPATAVSDGTVEAVIAELSLDVTSNNHAWIAKFPVGYTGFFGAGAAGDDISTHTFAVPRRINDTDTVIPGDTGGYRPVLYDNGVKVPETAAQDWFWDPVSSVVTSEGDLALGSTGTIEIYVYIGSKLDAAILGPASSTDNAIARFDLATGKLIQNSGVTISDTDNIVLPASATVDGRDVSVDGTKLDGIEAGADVTDSVNVNAVISAKFRRHSFIWYIESPAITDDFPARYIHDAATITSVVYVTGAGTADFNIEKRSKLTPDVAGTNIWTLDKTANTTGAESTTFDSASVAAQSWLMMDISAVTGAGPLWVAVVLTTDL